MDVRPSCCVHAWSTPAVLDKASAEGAAWETVRGLSNPEKEEQGRRHHTF